MSEKESLIPSNCEECSRKYTIKEKTNIKFQKKYLTLFIVSLLTPALFLALANHFNLLETGH